MDDAIRKAETLIEALSYIRRFRDRLIVIKLGGSAMEDPQALTATLQDVVRHCAHIREVTGIDHIGVGGDYDGVEVLPQGMEDVTAYPRLLEALAGRGWSDDDLANLTSGNILRVLRDTESGARALQSQRGPSLATIADLDGAPAA